MINNPYQQYQQNAIFTASKAELTLMLYNGAIKFCNLAIEAIEQKSMDKAHENIIKAENIIEELRITLEKKYSIAAEIDRLYEYIYNVLVQANIRKDIKRLEEAKYLIKEFRDVWQEVMKVRA